MKTQSPWFKFRAPKQCVGINGSDFIRGTKKIFSYDNYRLSKLIAHIFRYYQSQSTIDSINQSTEQQQEQQQQQNQKAESPSPSTSTSSATSAGNAVTGNKNLPISQSSLMADGFAVLKELDQQIELNRNTRYTLSYTSHTHTHTATFHIYNV